MSNRPVLGIPNLTPGGDEDPVPTGVDIPSILRRRGVHDYLAAAPWPAFASDTCVEFYAGQYAGYLFIDFHVRETEVLGRYLDDGAAVFEDSCVEFFVQTSDMAGYYNFEFNCLGTCLACVGADRWDRKAVEPGVREKIIRIPSLGRSPVHILVDSPHEWSLLVGIPLELFIYNIPVGANFYKCGDSHRFPHYLTWSAVSTPEPDYHRPDFFGRIVLEH